jgi:hypothetical protein
MSTATLRQQTYEEVMRELAIWEKELKPANLAETEYNKDAISNYLIHKYGGWINRQTLSDAVTALTNQGKLQYLAVQAPEKPKQKLTGNRLWNELVNAGVSPTRHQSVTDQQFESKKVEDRQQQFLTRAHLLNEQAQLLEEKSQAEYGHIVMHRLGIDHYRTGEARKAAKAKLLPKLQDFNNRCKSSDNDNLAIPV